MNYFVDLIAQDGSDFTSSNIDIVGYDRDTKNLYIEFHSSATVYVYYNVEESTYQMLVEADSVGSFYANHIKSIFTSAVCGPQVIELRESAKDATPMDYQPDVKGTSPGITAITPGKFGVSWTNGTLTFEPTFEALSEAEALALFEGAMRKVMPDATYKVKAVTHYFE